MERRQPASLGAGRATPLRWYAGCSLRPGFDFELGNVDPRGVFVKRFGDLVALLRVDPGNDAAQDLALSAAAAAVEENAVVVEAGVEHGTPADDLSLQTRLRARWVDLLRVGAGAPPEDLLHLAQALAHDTTPIPTTARVRVDLVPSVVPAGLAGDPDVILPDRTEADRRRWRERRRWRPERWQGPERRGKGDRRVTGERRLRLLKRFQAETARQHARLAAAVRTEAWRDGLEAAHGLLDACPRLAAAERRSFGLGVRRQLPRRALAGFIDVALRDPAERSRAVEVLRWVGLEGADAMVDAVRASDLPGPRRFLHDALGTMGEAYPSVAPLLNSAEAHEVRHAAEILGRMGRPEAVGPLKQQLSHGDAGVRAAVLLALAEFPLREVAETLRSALSHPSAATRAAAAEAAGRTGASGLVMPLVAALEVEQEAEPCSAIIRALASLASPEACAALTSVALARRRLLGGGYATSRRLEAVRALARVTAPCRRPSLERLAVEGDDPVRQAAATALAAGVPEPA